MDLILTRKSFTDKGIFGELTGYGFHCYTLEHSYDLQAKLAVGKYSCVRGIHRLQDGIPFEAFEVIGVPDFQGKPVKGILFHILNYNHESEGCIGIGKGFIFGKMITKSKIAFNELMLKQKDLDSFKLEVINP